MPNLTISGQSIQIDNDNYLLNPNDWSEAYAKEVASKEGISLTDKHWEIIGFVRDEFQKNGKMPSLRAITKNKLASTKEIYSLFTANSEGRIAKLSGLSKPKGCV
ncbi:sulfur relay protein, TusE/DsrC/DsvC family [Chloroherpeton thalassium ATCC 35110]|uniref:Sulfur relay protein, TusE/DsrC/DsvC family n=1 Tax=Chloroherpeton thalassium (strain ATCC 35110 / GB-78) TaxID=517418 RepID=B3QSP5_CHLT3|nr:TusE/DsrC/DsvC family sulfur relay protein [Chloroherpeton thalassium]ACF14092.1 sulfur relay protein, TusE/DsrC/DsvC family [Chloroherpeton thalassium ATCC 35110]